MAKTIILFSDGTGNSSGKLFKTNVWRMYQAVDLGIPNEPRTRIQIGRYDDGIGSSTFRPLALIQGIFGWGMQRNLLSLYLFLCRNYAEGDSICLFGFSRGAFTIRVLAELIGKQGVVRSENGEALNYLVKDAYRTYRRKSKPTMHPMRFLFPWLKRVRNVLIGAQRWLLRRTPYNLRWNHRAPIAFVGVWDTVSAYGGPIVEIVRAVDDWIMPISFTSQRLPRRVQTARHALALDDERDSFHPLPWDERHGEKEGRLKQVWFAGMHADVGGGYPDDSLAYVSLVWMMDEAKEFAQLRFRPDREKESRDQADGFGRIHDSRAGIGSYYRYQPRRIGAYIIPPEPGSESIRDQDQPATEGLRQPIKVHESVFRRIVSGTDGYAPIAIPEEVEIVSDRSHPIDHPGSLSLRARDRLYGPEKKRTRAAGQEVIWDYVWWRRIVYFLIVLSSLALATMPVWTGVEAGNVSAGVFDLFRIPLRWVRTVAPRYFDWWLVAFSLRPGISVGLIGWVATLFVVSRWLEGQIRAKSRALWAEALGSRVPPTAPSAGLFARALRAVSDILEAAVRHLRTHPAYQAVIGRFRWTVLPALFGVIMLGLLVLCAVTLMTQTRLSLGERNGLFCPGLWRTPAAHGSFRFHADRACNLAPVRVTQRQTYDVIVFVPDAGAWRDGRAAATPEGIPAGHLMPLGTDIVFVGMRRALDANWMQMLVYIAPARRNQGRAVTEPLVLAPGDAPGVYRGSFTAKRTGPLAMAVNEAVPPPGFRADFFYNGRAFRLGDAWVPMNRGIACISVTPHVASAAGSDSDDIVENLRTLCD